MGGKSKSNQSTSNQQSTANIVNDGEYAGVSGSVTHDESSTSDSHDIDDSYNTSNSQEINIDEDYDYSQDNDVDIDDSYNTDNSINLDDGSVFANGDISFVDAGAVEAARSIAETALTESTKQNKAANDLSREAINSNERVVGRAFSTAEYAIDEIEDIATHSVTTVGDTSEKIINELTSASTSFADNLKAAAQSSFTVNDKALTSVAESNTRDKALIAELAKSTSLDGQDIVAKSSEKMTMYMAIAAAIGFVAIAFIAARGK